MHILPCNLCYFPLYFVIAGSLYSIGQQLEQCYPFGVNLVRDMEEKLFELNLVGRESHGILQLETSLLCAGAVPNLLQGLFYLLPVQHEGKLFLR